jgi:2-succinyl-5-enolpyruvyl-6-hydroxy-3-cyclohexene-1-carboxylate synthase
MHSLDAANILVSSLRDQGVRRFVLSPGSRSAPLAYVLADAEARGEITLDVILDERSAAFFALGISKALAGASQMEPVALICTSGTAVANWHPAVLEASITRLPLLLLTADRPASLRGKLASQTIDWQAELFGQAVRCSFDVATYSIETHELDTLGRQAVNCALAPEKPGPVQINLQFVEPLIPPNSGVIGSQGSTMVIENSIPETAAIGHAPVDSACAPTIVIAADGSGNEAAMLAEAQGWPLFAEPTSGLTNSPNSIAAYRILLSWALANSRAMIPKNVVVFGKPSLSREIGELLKNPEILVTVISPGLPPHPDAWSNTAKLISTVDPRWLTTRQHNEQDDFLKLWIAASESASQSLHVALEPSRGAQVAKEPRLQNQPFAPLAVARTIWQKSSGEPLLIGASSPIRDVDLVSSLSPKQAHAQVFANRGLAGIDGTIATAFGIASASDNLTTTRLFCGDLTFLHDVSSLMLSHDFGNKNLQIIVASDGGGTIFSGLEHGAWAADSANRQAILNRVFTTPSKACIADLCHGYQVSYRSIGYLNELRDSVANPKPGVQVLEVLLNGATRSRLDQLLSATISSGLKRDGIAK